LELEGRLLDAGLVTEQRHGRERRYRLVPARLGAVRDWIAHYRSAKSTTKQAAKKAAARPGPRADKADAESAVLAKIAAMPEPDRALVERLHAIIKASAPALSPRRWYGMPAYAKERVRPCC
jgi:hypothetical protein